ncbi:MAG: hypothetical protein K2G28_13235 [Acetatifactor sp.]|nr:hypothetical protein [Acetatifactor sp.]MDE7353664.1 hypothetical protein [Acetatifactor sp.]
MTGMIVVALVILMLFLVGNLGLIVVVCGTDFPPMSEGGIFIVGAVIIDLFLLYYVIKKIAVSFRLVRSGLKNRALAKETAACLKNGLEKEELYVCRLQELRELNVRQGNVRRTVHFCQLVETLIGREQMQACLSRVSEKQHVLEEIGDIENKIFDLAVNYKDADDTEKSMFYLNLLKITKATDEITSLEEECKEHALKRKKENNAIMLWIAIFLMALGSAVIFFLTFFNGAV